MDEPAFWTWIHLIDPETVEDDEYEAVEPLIAALAKTSVAEIESFEEHLAQRLYGLDGRRYADEADESSNSGDGFLYARCFVVAQGEAHYRRVLADPKLMPKSSVEWCEALITVGPIALERATGSAGEIETSVSYETGSNRAQWG
jgi:DNA-binding protein YbaB